MEELVINEKEICHICEGKGKKLKETKKAKDKQDIVVKFFSFLGCVCLIIPLFCLFCAIIGIIIAPFIYSSIKKKNILFLD